MIAASALARAFFIAIVALSATARAQSQGSAAPPPQPRPPGANYEGLPLASDDGLRLTFGLGGSATGVSRNPRLALPLEVTLVPKAYLTTSAGFLFSSLGVEDAYAELGFYLVVSLAAGIGYGQRETSHGVSSDPIGHVFVGVPVTLNAEDAWQKKWFTYALPYYRPSWDLRSHDVAHEIGLMIKVSYAIRVMSPPPVFF